MLYLECYPDEALVRSLIPILRWKPIHGCKGDVCNYLRRHGSSVGLIDDDPNSPQPPYVREAKLVEDLTELGIRILRHSSNQIIVLSPRLEEWILGAAKEANVDCRKYGLPVDGKKLHQEINLKLDKFENLLEDLKSSSNRLKALRQILQERV